MAKRRKSQFKAVLLALPVAIILGLLTWYLRSHTIAVLQPAGPIAHKERNLMGITILLAAIVVLPVYAMTVLIALKYRESNHQKKKVTYAPDWDHSRLFESIWWGIPIVIIGILSVITWNSSHTLDPYKPLASSVQPITVQVVALDWKWLFIYPNQHVASVNLVEMPVNTPINFQITSDAVMNSFWIPQLSGQIYAMPGMDTQLHLMASRGGSFYGSPANIAGSGFARMNFTAQSVSTSDFNRWLHMAQSSPKHLDVTAYSALAQPSDNNPVVVYSQVTDGLFANVVSKYMAQGAAGMEM
jgi:cytochrome o ubiquinol oxidase subunit II